MELKKIEYPDKIGNGEWRKVLVNKPYDNKGLFVLYDGNFIDVENDGIELWLLDQGVSYKTYLDMILEIGDINLRITGEQLYELPFSKGLDFNVLENYGVLASKICRALGFEYFDWEKQKIKEDNEKISKE